VNHWIAFPHMVVVRVTRALVIDSIVEKDVVVDGMKHTDGQVNLNNINVLNTVRDVINR
jgi:hypothetical protein